MGIASLRLSASLIEHPRNDVPNKSELIYMSDSSYNFPVHSKLNYRKFTTIFSQSDIY